MAIQLLLSKGISVGLSGYPLREYYDRTLAVIYLKELSSAYRFSLLPQYHLQRNKFLSVHVITKNKKAGMFPISSVHLIPRLLMNFAGSEVQRCESVNAIVLKVRYRCFNGSFRKLPCSSELFFLLRIYITSRPSSTLHEG